MNKKGQLLGRILIFIMVFIIFIFASPMLFQVVTIGQNSTGSLSGFVATLFPWVILFSLLWWVLRLIRGSKSPHI